MRFPDMVRKRIVEMSMDQRMEVWEIAATFKASESGVRRVLQRFRERGTHRALPLNPGRKPQMTDVVAQQIHALVAADADATREQIRMALGLGVCQQTVGVWLRRLGLVLKKSR